MNIDPQDARSALDALVRAVLAGDEPALERLVADDFVGVGYAGQVVDKAAYIAVHVDHSSNEGRFTRFDVSGLTFAPLAEGALVHGTQHVTARLDLTSCFVQLWRGVGGALRLAFHQETVVDAGAGRKGT